MSILVMRFIKEFFLMFSYFSVASKDYLNVPECSFHKISFLITF